MRNKIAIIASLNSYAEEISYFKEVVEAKGHETLLIDISMGGESPVKADVTSAEVAASVGASIEDIRASTDRQKITALMSSAVYHKVLDLFARGEFSAIIVVGGATTNLRACEAIQALPFGLPKMMVSSSGADPAWGPKYFGNRDIILMHTLVDPSGLNNLSRNVLDRAAGAICGVAGDFYGRKVGIALGEGASPFAGVTTFAFADRCERNLRKYLLKEGWQVAVFHAQGLGDKAMDWLIDQGFPFKVIIDLVPSGVGEEYFGGMRPGGKRRLEAAGERGIPQVLAPAGMNFISTPTWIKKRKYLNRPGRVIDDIRTELKMVPSEMAKTARLMADKLVKARGVVKFLIPTKGWSALEREGGPLYEPELHRIFLEEFRKRIGKAPHIEIREINAHIEDEAFAKAVFAAVREVAPK